MDVAGAVAAADPMETRAIAATLAGDRQAFTPLVERYQQGLYRLAYRLLGSAGEAEEAVQEAFVKAFTALGQFHTDQPFGPWLYRIVRNACMDRLRVQQRTVQLPEHDLALRMPPVADAAAAALQRLAAAEVRGAIADLPDLYRDLVVMAHLQDLSYDAIVRSTGLPLTVVKNRLFRARQMLREKLLPTPGQPAGERGSRR